MSILLASASSLITLTQNSIEADIISPDIYGTLPRANRYFDNRLRATFWINAELDDKKRALIESTRIIDSLNFAGSKADPSQTHQFPRRTLGNAIQRINGVTDEHVPLDIEIATYEIAIQLLSGIDPDIEVENLAAISQGFSTARTTYERAYVLEHIAAGVPSARAWNLIKPYMRSPRRLNLSRVN